MSNSKPNFSSKYLNFSTETQGKILNGDKVIIWGDKNFLKIWPHKLTPLLNKSMSVSTYKIFFLLTAIMDKKNTVYLTIADIEKHLKLSKKTIVESIKELKSYDLIRNTGKSHYMINPNCIYDGKNTLRNIALKEYTKISIPKELKKAINKELQFKEFEKNFDLMDNDKKNALIQAYFNNNPSAKKDIIEYCMKKEHDI